MYGKQIFKDGVSKTVLSIGGQVGRIFDREELCKVFQLSPRGKCDVVDKLKEEGRGNIINPKQHAFIMSHPKVLGITRHDGIYNETRLLSASDKSSNGTRSPCEVGDSEEETDVLMEDEQEEEGQEENEHEASPPGDEVENKVSPPVIEVASENEASSPPVVEIADENKASSRPAIDVVVAVANPQTSCASSIDRANDSNVPGSELCPLMIE